MRYGKLIGIVAAFALTCGQAAWAGPVIIDGTDSNDHGSASGSVNQDGWLYMQKALENLASQVSGGVAKVVVNLGATNGGGSSDAFDAIHSAFSKSSLPGLGWSITDVDNVSGINAWLSSLATSNTGILYIPTESLLTPSDLTNSEAAAVNSHATDINNFVAGPGNPLLGGALFAQGENPGGGVDPYGWLKTLIPGISVTSLGGGGANTDLTLTAAGQAAFPGLTNADLSAGPWHDFFSGSLGGLSVLATAPESNKVGSPIRNVIIGGGAGTVIGCGGPGQPPCDSNGVVPEPASIALLGLGGAMAAVIRRRKSA